MNIVTAKVIKLKLHVSVPGWPEKPAPKNPVGKKDRKSGTGQALLTSPPGLCMLNKLLKITKSAKAKIQFRLNNRQRILENIK